MGEEGGGEFDVVLVVDAGDPEAEDVGSVLGQEFFDGDVVAGGFGVFCGLFHRR